MSSLALLAAPARGCGEIAAAMTGGHGELFVQQFDSDLSPLTVVLNLAPEAAAAAIGAGRVAGPGAETLVQARGHGTAVEAWPSAALALSLPVELRALAPAPFYARAPDAKALAPA